MKGAEKSKIVNPIIDMKSQFGTFDHCYNNAHITSIKIV